MAEWVSHLIIADRVMERVPGLCRHEFCVGNIAPDCNYRNPDGKTFTPSREITHWMKHERKTATDCDDFFTAYILERMDRIRSKQELSFLLGYYAHLITDAELQRTIRDPERVAEAWKRIRIHPELAPLSVGMDETWDNVKRLIPREERMKDFYVIEREYLDAHADSGYFTEIAGLESFPDYIDYLPHNAIPDKIKVMYYMPASEPCAYHEIAFTRKEYEDALNRAERIAVEAIEEISLLTEENETIRLGDLRSRHDEFVSGIVDDPYLCRMYGFSTPADGERIFRQFSALPGACSIIRKSDDRMIGFILCVKPEAPEQILAQWSGRGKTLAYATFTPFRRMGYMTQAIRLVTEHLFQTGCTDYIHCGRFDYNLNSANLLKKLGFEIAGTHWFREQQIMDTVLWRNKEFDGGKK